MMDITLALQRAVRSYEHGTEALASILGISKHSLNHKVDPRDSGAHCSPDEVHRIQEITGDHGPLFAQAEALGYLLLPMPDVETGSTESTNALTAAVVEFGEFISEAARDMHDNSVSDNELSRIEREGTQALAAIHKLMQVAHALNRTKKPEMRTEPRPLRRAIGAVK